MEDIIRLARSEAGLSAEEIRAALLESLRGRALQNVLILPPDFTRFHSNAGYITNVYYHVLTDAGVHVDILPALGTHVPVTEEQWIAMFGDIPYETMLIHDWRHDVVKLGEVPADYLAEITGNLWTDPVSVEINRRVMEKVTHLILVSDASRKGLQVVKTIHTVAKELVMFEKAGLIVNRMPDRALEDQLDTGQIPLLACIGDDRAMSMSDVLGNSVFSLAEDSEILRGVEKGLTGLDIL